MRHFFHQETATWVRREKQENKIGGNLSLRRRRIEMLNARIKSLLDLNGKGPDKFGKLSNLVTSFLNV